MKISITFFLFYLLYLLVDISHSILSKQSYLLPLKTPPYPPPQHPNKQTNSGIVLNYQINRYNFDIFWYPCKWLKNNYPQNEKWQGAIVCNALLFLHPLFLVLLLWYFFWEQYIPTQHMYIIFVINICSLMCVRSNFDISRKMRKRCPFCVRDRTHGIMIMLTLW